MIFTVVFKNGFHCTHQRNTALVLHTVTFVFQIVTFLLLKPTSELPNEIRSVYLINITLASQTQVTLALLTKIHVRIVTKCYSRVTHCYVHVLYCYIFVLYQHIIINITLASHTNIVSAQLITTAIALCILHQHTLSMLY